MLKKGRYLFNLLGALPLLFSFLVSAAPTPSACIQAGPIGITPSPTTVSMTSSGTATVTYTFTNLTNSASFQLGTLTPTITGDAAHISASVANGCSQPIGPAPLSKTCTQTVTLTSQQALSTASVLNVQVCDTRTPPIFCSKTSTCNQVDITVAPVPPVLSTIYVGVFDGTVYFSTNNGSSWTQTATNPANHTVYGVFKTSDALYASAVTFIAPPPGEGDVFRSTDNGGTWNPLLLGLLNVTPASIFVKPEAGSDYTIYATATPTSTPTTPEDVLVYTSATLSWATTPTQPEPGIAVASIAYAAGTLYAGMANGNVQISTNNGTSWTPTTQPDGTNPVVSIYATSSASRIYASTTSAPGVGTLWVSTTDGSTWAPTTQPPDGTLVTGISVTSTGAIYVSTVAGNVAYSTDEGTTWQNTDNPPPVFAPLTSISVG